MRQNTEDPSGTEPAITSLTALGRYFPGSWNYNRESLMRLPVEQRPSFLIRYSDIHELNIARSVEPPHCQVAYYYAGPQEEDLESKMESIAVDADSGTAQKRISVRRQNAHTHGQDNEATDYRTERNARARYSVLIDQKFRASLSIDEEHELEHLGNLLDSAEAPFYEPVKRRLRAALHKLLQYKNPVTDTEGNK